jgi:WD40 repeat protein
MNFQGHEKGVLGLAWCQDDPELLLSCGKDSRIHCWNPNYPHQVRINFSFGIDFYF